MNCTFRSCCVPLILSLSFLHVHGAEPSPTTEEGTIVTAVWNTPGSAGGREVVVRPDGEKLKALGVTFEQLSKALCGRRFVESKWVVEVGGHSIDLSDVAELAVREVKSRPFTVELKDGRTIFITPDPARVSRYVITGADFERMVRDTLSGFSGGSVAEYCVLSGVPVPGNVGPHMTERGSRRHISLGEPLKTFAKVAITEHE
jgi:hypothetical protein